MFDQNLQWLIKILFIDQKIISLIEILINSHIKTKYSNQSNKFIINSFVITKCSLI